MKNMKTKIEIIDECVEHIQNQGRALDVYNRCTYHDPNGRTCGHGYFCKEEMRPKLSGCAFLIIKRYGDVVHNPEYRGHTADFWVDIQNLHDTPMNWNGKKLTREGEDRVKWLKIRWLEGQA